MTDHEEKPPLSIPPGELRRMAASVAEELRSVPEGAALPADLRARFIAVRAALFQRGIYDPVLARFDSATVSRASLHEIAEELAKLAE